MFGNRAYLVLSMFVFFLCAGCIERDRYFTITASYLLKTASHNGLSVRAGGIVPAGHDLATTSFAYVRFVGFAETPRDIVICLAGGDIRWFSTPPYPGTGKISDWITQERDSIRIGGSEQNDIEAMMQEAGVRWSGANVPRDIGRVLLSSLGGPKGAIRHPEESSDQIAEITHSRRYTNNSDWVDLMLDTCR